MDLKETATEGESSKLMEATEPMEGSSAVATASLTKRKAESDSAEESEESGDEVEESGDEGEESGDEYVVPDDELLATWWTPPEWDVDSYEDRVYHSSQEENGISDDEHEKLWRRCKRQLIETKGFYVEPELIPWSNYSEFKPVTDLELPAGYNQTYREYFAEMACLCLQKFNQEHSEQNGFNVEFVEVVRGLYSKGSRSKSYITFMAREKPHGPLVEYQAKVWCTFVEGENYPILCRPAPKANHSNQN